MPLVNLIYASSAVKRMSQEELIAILEKSRENNEKRNITGMLLYKDGNFLQVLEGENDAVTDLYYIITKDERHTDPQLLLKREITKRTFSEWEMGFINLEDVDKKQIAGFSDFLEKPLGSISDGNLAYTMLETFKSMIP
jgi:hypothetical protein